MFKYFTGVLTVAALTGLDQFTKYMAASCLKDGPFVIWEGVFEFHYSENRGAAFGILQEQRVFFILVTCAVLCAVAWLYSRIPDKKKYLPLNILCLTVAAGALGNFIDRFRLGYVIDFLYFKLIDFPIFNLSDCYITVSCVLFIGVMFFCYGEDDMSFLRLKRNSGRNKTPDIPQSEGE